MNLAKVSSIALALACLLPAVGCGPSVKDRLVGTWQGTFEIDQAAADKIKAENPLAAKAIESTIKSAGPAFTNAGFDITLNADGTMTSSSSSLNYTSSGTWELKSSSEGKAVIVTKAGDKTHEKMLTLDADFLKGTGGFVMPAPGPLADYANIRFKRK